MISLIPSCPHDRNDSYPEPSVSLPKEWLSQGGQGGGRPLMIKGLVSEKNTKLGKNLHLRGRVNNISGKAINSTIDVWSIVKAPVQTISDRTVKKARKEGRIATLVDLCNEIRDYHLCYGKGKKLMEIAFRPIPGRYVAVSHPLRQNSYWKSLHSPILSANHQMCQFCRQIS